MIKFISNKLPNIFLRNDLYVFVFGLTFLKKLNKLKYDLEKNIFFSFTHDFLTLKKLKRYTRFRFLVLKFIYILRKPYLIPYLFYL